MITIQPVYLREQKLKEVLPFQVQTHLAKLGFEKAEVDGLAEYWTPPKVTGATQDSWFVITESEFANAGRWQTDFMVTIDPEARNYTRHTAQLIIALGMYENRHAAQVLDDILKLPKVPATEA